MIAIERLRKLPKRLVVTFAADCAEHVLPIFEQTYPDDPRPREAIMTVRDWLRGAASQEDLDRVRLAAAKASGKPLGSHAVTGAPGWMTGLLASEAEEAATAALCAVNAAFRDDAGDVAQAALIATQSAATAVIWAWEERHGVDFATATAAAEPRELAWQAERLASLESDPSLNVENAPFSA